MKSLLRITILTFFVCGCGDRSDGDSAHKNVAAMCNDMAEVVAELSVRCDAMDRDEAYNDFLETELGGTCDDVHKVRDRDALYNDCLPTLKTISCDKFTDVDSIPSCRNQLLSPVRACEDMASAVASASARCEDADREVAYQSYLELAVNGSCDNVVAIRDYEALRDACIPALSTIECNAFIQGNIPSVCIDQLIKDR